MRLAIDIPEVPTGAKTCGSCPYYWHIPRICSLFKGPGGEQLYVKNKYRLPECLAVEREQTSEYWETHLPDGTLLHQCAREPEARKEARECDGAAVTHVTRWKRLTSGSVYRSPASANPPEPISGIESQLRRLCERYIQDNKISCRETIWQCDWVSETALQFIDDVAKLVGFHSHSPRNCPSCAGGDTLTGGTWRKCNRCNGTGEIGDND